MYDQKIVFFGCPLDSDERDESVQEKLTAMSYGPKADDPYAYVMGFIRSEIDQGLWEEIGSLEVPEWLRPIPPAGEKGNINVESFYPGCPHRLGRLPFEHPKKFGIERRRFSCYT